jgi:hypothetical protein
LSDCFIEDEGLSLDFDQIEVKPFPNLQPPWSAVPLHRFGIDDIKACNRYAKIPPYQGGAGAPHSK